MKLKITEIILIVFFLFLPDSCNNKIKYDDIVINYDYEKFDGVLIYNRSSDIIIFDLFKSKNNKLVFVNNDSLEIIKKPINYALTDEEIIILIKEYKKLNFIYCRVDYNNIIRVSSNGIDYVKINKHYNDTIYLFNEHINEYKYIGNDWYIKKQ